MSAFKVITNFKALFPGRWILNRGIIEGFDP